MGIEPSYVFQFAVMKADSGAGLEATTPFRLPVPGNTEQITLLWKRIFDETVPFSPTH
tara:strand:- start:434 stop:607 length:174 start_codon:yes stop_codon:yes gene_type:complete